MIVKPGEFFYSFAKHSKWHISQDSVLAIKELKPVFYEGYYVDRVLSFRIDDNESILDKYRGKLSRTEFMSHIGINIQLLLRTVKMENIPPYFIHKMNLQDYHIKLLNRFYIDFNDYEQDAIDSGDKRPFGNSSIESDIVEIWKPEINELDDYGSFYEDNRDKIWQIYNDVLDLAVLVISKFPMDFRNFIKVEYPQIESLPDFQRKYYNHTWAPDISEFRDIKIEKLLS
jgi:hypothetical protein